MKASREHGTVMLECLIVLPIMLGCIMAIAQMAQIWTAKQVVQYAAYSAARAARTANSLKRQQSVRVKVVDISGNVLSTSIGTVSLSDAEIRAAKAAAAVMSSMNELVARRSDDHSAMLLEGLGNAGNGSFGNTTLKFGDYYVTATVKYNLPLWIPKMWEAAPLLLGGEYGRSIGENGGFSGSQLPIVQKCVLPLPYKTGGVEVRGASGVRTTTFGPYPIKDCRADELFIYCPVNR